MKKIKPIDIILILAFIAALIVGFLTYKKFRQTAFNRVEYNSQIIFQVFLRGVTLTGLENPITVKSKTFISIRNVPYTELEVLNVETAPRKIIVADSGKKPLITIDPSQPNLYDIVVTVSDTAKITKDGAVVGGNKIKMGLPITLEGIDYKFNGTVSNIRLIVENKKEEIEEKVEENVEITEDKKGDEEVTIEESVKPEEKEDK